MQVASEQTLARRKIIPQADLVMIDEAHRWFDFYERWMNLPEWQKVPFIGLSATPWTKGLGKHFDDLIIAATTQELIDKGFLSPFRVFAPPVKPDLSKIRTIAGDWHEGQLSAEMQKPHLMADVVQTWLEKGEDRPTLCFAVDCAHAKKLQEQFEKAGVPTAYVDAYTSRDERRTIRHRLRDGDIKVIVNIGCMTTGTDLPFVSCIILARPTKSEMLYVQIVGRGLRTDDGKEDCLIFDHSDTTVRLGFVTDIHHDELDDGKLSRSKSKTQEREKPLPKECGMCGRIKPVGVHKCPDCGFEARPPSKVKTVSGELTQLCGKAVKHDKDTKQKWYSMLLSIRDQRGYKDGWAANQYRQKFGVWPKGLSEIRMRPSGEVNNFVISRQIAFAKSADRRSA